MKSVHFPQISLCFCVKVENAIIIGLFEWREITWKPWWHAWWCLRSNAQVINHNFTTLLFLMRSGIFTTWTNTPKTVFGFFNVNDTTNLLHKIYTTDCETYKRYSIEKKCRALNKFKGTSKSEFHHWCHVQFEDNVAWDYHQIRKRQDNTMVTRKRITGQLFSRFIRSQNRRDCTTNMYQRLREIE